MNAIMKSVSPKECERIARGEQTILVCKTRPKIYTQFKGYIYQTRESKKRFLDHRFNSFFAGKSHYEDMGKVIGEFICDRIYEIKNLGSSFMIGNDIALTNRIARESCLDYDDMIGYLGNKDGYGWHISDVKIYDKPKELEEFFVKGECPEENCSFCKNFHRGRGWLNGDTYDEDDCILYGIKPITRPPKSWCYVESLGE